MLLQKVCWIMACWSNKQSEYKHMHTYTEQAIDQGWTDYCGKQQYKQCHVSVSLSVSLSVCLSACVCQFVCLPNLALSLVLRGRHSQRGTGPLWLWGHCLCMINALGLCVYVHVCMHAWGSGGNSMLMWYKARGKVGYYLIWNYRIMKLYQ